MSISLCSLQKEYKMYVCPLQNPSHSLGILSFHDFFLALLFQRLQNTCLFYYLSLLQGFCHLPAETKNLNYFLPGCRWKKNIKQHRTRADFHRAPVETHQCDDESSLPMAFGICQTHNNTSLSCQLYDFFFFSGNVRQHKVKTNQGLYCIDTNTFINRYQIVLRKSIFSKLF